MEIWQEGIPIKQARAMMVVQIIMGAVEGREGPKLARQYGQLVEGCRGPRGDSQDGCRDCAQDNE